MQIIYRVKIDYMRVAMFDFNNIEQACKFADAAKVTNVNNSKVKVSIELLTKEEAEADD